LDELLNRAETEPQDCVNTLGPKGSPHPPSTIEEVEIAIKKLRGHKGPATDLTKQK
jgi:hypothetical protein